jgi:hypothetical protein
MKLKTRKVPNYALTADQLGFKYNDAKILESEAKEALAAATANIKSVSKSIGHTNGKETTIQGKTFEVGFMEVEPSMSLDPARVRRVLFNRPSILGMVTVKTISEEKVAELVRKRLITQKQLLKMCVPKGGGQRVIVRKLKPKARKP